MKKCELCYRIKSDVKRYSVPHGDIRMCDMCYHIWTVCKERMKRDD